MGIDIHREHERGKQLAELLDLGVSLLFIPLLSAALTGCVSRYQQAPWAACIYSEGNAYLLQGTQTIKTANLLTADGTFKKFSFPVKRDFHLLQNGDPSRDLGYLSQKADDLTVSRYQFFPQSNSLLSLEDYQQKIQNLSLRKSFHVGGNFISSYQNHSRFCLVEDSHNRRFFEVDKITGRSVPLSPASATFLVNLWHTELFLSDDGSQVTRAQVNYAKKTINISAWDLNHDTLRLRPHTISCPDASLDANILLCRADADSVILALVQKRSALTNASRISVQTFDPHTFDLRQNILAEFTGYSPHVVKEGPDTIALLFAETENPFSTARRWVLRRYDLATGSYTSSQTINLPPSTTQKAAERSEVPTGRDTPHAF